MFERAPKDAAETGMIGSFIAGVMAGGTVVWFWNEKRKAPGHRRPSRSGIDFTVRAPDETGQSEPQAVQPPRHSVSR